MYVLLMGLGLLAAGPPPTEDRCSHPGLEKALEAIATAPQIGGIYSRDGAAEEAVIADHRETSPLSEHVHQILECEGKSAPILVEHLDSARLTTANIDGQPAPLGFISQDLLLTLTYWTSPPRVKGDCDTDGLCACVELGYCFDPSGLPIRRRNGKTRPSPTQTQVKKNWQKLLQRGSGRFKYPESREAQYYLVKAVARYQSLGYLVLRSQIGRREITMIGPTPTGRTFKLDVFVKGDPKSKGKLQVLLWLEYGDDHLNSRYFGIDPDGHVTDEGGG